jgi:hypothetical protein
MSVLDIYCGYGISRRVPGSGGISEWFLLAHVIYAKLKAK